MNKISFLLLVVAICSPVIEAGYAIREHNVHTRARSAKSFLRSLAVEADDLLFPEGRLLLRGEQKITSRDQIHLLFTVPAKGDAEPDEQDYELVKGLRELDDLEALIEGEEVLVSITKKNLIDFVKGVVHGIGRKLGNPEKCVKEVPAMAKYFSQATTYIRSAWKKKSISCMKKGLISLGKAIYQFTRALKDCGVISLIKAISEIAAELETGSWGVLIKDHIIAVLRNKKELAKVIVSIADAWISKSWFKAGDALGYMLALILVSSGEGDVLPSLPLFVPGCASCAKLASDTELGSAHLLLSGAIFMSTGMEHQNEDVVRAGVAQYRDAMYIMSLDLEECDNLKEYRSKLESAYKSIDSAFENDKVDVSFAEDSWKVSIDGKDIRDITSDLSADIIGDQSVSAGEKFEKLVNLFA